MCKHCILPRDSRDHCFFSICFYVFGCRGKKNLTLKLCVQCVVVQQKEIDFYITKNWISPCKFLNCIIPKSFCGMHLYLSWAARVNKSLTYSVVQNCAVLHIFKKGVQFSSIWLSMDVWKCLNCILLRYHSYLR